MDRFARALDYPYERPSRSFMICMKNGILPFQMPTADKRTPVIVAGSNAAPSRLLDKYDGGSQTVIPVQHARLRDYSAVYSCHFSAYGSVPATMEQDLGSESQIHVVWLTADQLTIMHETESLGQNYRFAMLENISLDLDGGQRLDSCAAYLSLRGALRKDGSPVRLAEFETSGSRFNALTQEDMQNFCRSVLTPDIPLRRFVMENIEDPAVRRDRIAQLRHYGGVPSCPSARTLIG